MTENTKNKQIESHPLLPSCEWLGFYCYHHSPEQHRMTANLHFCESKVTGAGVDDVSTFVWKGSYDIDNFKIIMTKHYSTHTVLYKGDIDENGIWGVWEIQHDFSKFPDHLVTLIKEAYKNDLTGGFHLWPKNSKSGVNSNSLEEKNKSEKLNDIFLEVFA